MGRRIDPLARATDYRHRAAALRGAATRAAWYALWRRFRCAAGGALRSHVREERALALGSQLLLPTDDPLRAVTLQQNAPHEGSEAAYRRVYRSANGGEFYAYGVEILVDDALDRSYLSRYGRWVVDGEERSGLVRRRCLVEMLRGHRRPSPLPDAPRPPSSIVVDLVPPARRQRA